MKIVEYKESYGEYKLPEGFEESLKGLSIEEQMDRYRTSGSSTFSNTGWSERSYARGYRKLENDGDVRGLIVKDGIVIGVLMCDDCGREVPCFGEERVCTYYADDNNGAGSKCRIDYTYLVCVPSENAE